MRAWLLVVLLAGAMLIVPVIAESVTVNFLPCIIADDIGAAHPVNNYTMETSGNADNATWNLLASNDYQTFAVLDSRKGETFVAGTMREFHIGNEANYQYYYIYLVGGFPTSETLEWHLNETVGGAPAPLYSTDYYLNWTMSKRSPLVTAFNLTGAVVGNYTINSTSTSTVTWYLYGTNTTEWLGATSGMTLIDSQSALLTAGTDKLVELSSQVGYNIYIVYVESGLTSDGTIIWFRFGSGGVPPVTPVPTPTPTVTNITMVAGTQAQPYTDIKYVYILGLFSTVLFIGSMMVTRTAWIFSGVSLLLTAATGYTATRADIVSSVSLYDPATVLGNGTVITNSTMLTNTVHYVVPSMEIAVGFFILCAICFVQIIRLYLEDVTDMEEENL